MKKYHVHIAILEITEDFLIPFPHSIDVTRFEYVFHVYTLYIYLHIQRTQSNKNTHTTQYIKTNTTVQCNQCKTNINVKIFGKNRTKINGIEISKLRGTIVNRIEETESRLRYNKDTVSNFEVYAFRMRMFVSLIFGQRHTLTKRVVSMAYPGAIVTLQNLSKSELNGKSCRVINWNEKRKRWKVCLKSNASKKIIAVRPENVTRIRALNTN